MGIKRGLDIELIIQTAAELAEEQGLENITVNRLADKLGVKPPSLYNHISGLTELSSGLAQMALRKLEDAIRKVAVGKAKAEALMAIAIAYRHFARENPELYKAIMKLTAYGDEELRERGLVIVRILYQVMEPYAYSEEDAIHFVRGFRSVLHGFVSLEEAGFFKAAINPDESFTRVVAGMISSIDHQGKANQ